MNMFDLSNKVAIVTGGNRGIGLAIARGRAGAPQDCVSAALFLASDASDFVTGHVLFADGGTTIC